MKKIYRQVFGGFTIVLVLLLLGLYIFSNSKKISFKHPLTNHHPDQHRFKHVKQSHNEDQLRTRVNRTYLRPSLRRQATGNEPQRMIYDGDLKKQQSHIDRVKADHQISCSPEDTEFIKSLHKSDAVYLPDKETLRQLSLRELEILYHRMKSNSYRRGPSSYFYAIGIAGNNQVLRNGRELLNYETIRKRLGHLQFRAKKISRVKLDIELWEHAALPTMLTAGSLNQVDNLAVEFHLDWIKGPVDPQEEAETYLKGLIILKDLYDNGFRIFWTRRNMDCGFKSRCTGEMRTACQEVSFIRVKR